MVIVKTFICLVQRLDFYSIDYVYTKIKFQFLLSSFIHHNPLSSPKQKELERLGKWGEIWREMGIGWKGGIHQIPSLPENHRGWKYRRSKQGLKVAH
jgi:hypothetical protein